MKTFRLIYLALAAVLISSCQAEIWEPFNPDALDSVKDSGLELSISSQALLPIDASATKANGAVATDLNEILSTINDLNIKINLNDNTSQYFYCDKTSKPQNTSYIAGNNLAEFSTNKLVQIHFDKINSSQVKDIEIIANAKSILDANTWKNAKEVGLCDPSKDCMMYGRSIAEPSDNSHLAQPAPACKNYNISLRRTRAMVSVKILNGGLKKGVAITPLTLRICNIPEICNIKDFASQPGNKLNENNKNIVIQEIPLTWGTLEGKDDGSSGGYVGFEHPENPTSIPDEMKQYLVFPLENMQGTHNASNTNHSTKYPSGINSVADAKDPLKNHNYTYLEIEADYKYRELSDVKIGGTIIYRFFLGKNEISNFDIEGNVYYRVNLNLLGYGGAKEDGKLNSDGTLVVNTNDASWRVDMQTTDWGFEQSQFDFDSHLILGKVKVVGQNWKFSKVLRAAGKDNPGDLDAGSMSWLMINVKGFGGYKYANPTQIIDKTDSKFEIGADGTLKFVVQPMTYLKNGSLDPEGQFDENTYCQKINYREMVLQVQNLDNKSQFDTIYVRQYAPIPFTAGGVTLFMERFEEYTDSQNKGYPWGHQGNDLNDLHDQDGVSLKDLMKSYNYGESVSKDNVGLNTTYLMPKYHHWDVNKNEWVDYELAGENGAAHVCYIKGTTGSIDGLAGNPVEYYSLPSQVMLAGMFDRCKQYDKSTWGPFEPMNIYSDYWTCSVPKNNSTSTIYYNSNNRDYPTTTDRNAIKRVRAVYTVQGATIKPPRK